MPDALSARNRVTRPANRLYLGLRLLARDWRAGELRILAAALVIAVAAASAIGFFSDRITRALAFQSADLLGADLMLASPRPVPDVWIARATQSGLKTARALAFASVILRGDKLNLASIRAVHPGFPPRGALRTASERFGTDAPTDDVPAPGTAWVESRLFSLLGISVGDRIEVGATELTVTRVLTYEPDRGGAFFTLAPRVLMNEADIAKTGVIQPGSKVTYQYLFAGSEAAIAVYRRWLDARLGPSHVLIDVRDGDRAVGRALTRAERYLGLATMVAVALAGVAIAMGARHYSQRHFDVSAMMRCVGATQSDIVMLYVPQLLLLGIAASLIGCIIGWFTQEALLYLLADLLPPRLPAPSVQPVIAALLTGLITLAGFALPPVLRLRNVPPVRVLRRDIAPLPLSGWVVYTAAGAALVVLMWRHTGNWALTFSVVGGGAAAAVLLAVTALALLNAARGLQGRVGVAWRFGFNNLWRRPQASVGQILAFGLTFMAMALIALVRTDLFSTWESRLPDDAPNQFAFNVLPKDVESVRKFFSDNGIRATALYPMVRGRLIAINDVPVRQAVTKEAREDESLNRELNLTWTATLPADNAIVRGQWWEQGNSGNVVSVEERLARKLGIKLGDVLTFSIGSQALQALVGSIRSVQWESFHPNFYMIFQPGALAAYPATYLTSFYLEPARKNLLNQLVRRFPSISVIEMDLVLAQVRTLLRQVTLAVELVLTFVLLAGFAVLFASLLASRDERIYEGALLRTLGASRRQLRASHLTEFCVLGVLAGVLAALGAELIAYFLYSRVLDLPYGVKWQVWVIAPIAGGVLVGLAGYWGTRKVLRLSPLAVLRDA